MLLVDESHLYSNSPLALFLGSSGNLCCSGYFDDKLETFVEIPSDNCPFNEAPHMKAREITEAGKEALLSEKFQMVRVNFANPGKAFSRGVFGQSQDLGSSQMHISQAQLPSITFCMEPKPERDTSGGPF